MGKKGVHLLSIGLMFFLLIMPSLEVIAEESRYNIFINEIESNDPVTDIDWVEIINTGDETIDLSGWFITDDKDLERLEKNKEWRIEEGTKLAPNELLVIEHDVVLNNLSLGKSDVVSLYTKEHELVDTYTYNEHAQGTYSRVPDGRGEFIDQTPTRGELNKVPEEVLPEENLIINEINSSPDDWIELINIGTKEMDLASYELRDNSDDHRFQFKEGTGISPNEFFVVEADTAGLIYDDQEKKYKEGTFQEAIGLGSGDAVRLYNPQGDLIDTYEWVEHASFSGDASKASYGRYPDATGEFVLTKVTKGMQNDWYKPEVVINEVESNDDKTDWVEIYNKGNVPIDLSGWYMYDDDPVGHANDISPVKAGTILNPGEFFVFDGDEHFSFGLGKNDKATVFNHANLVIDEFAWEGHAEGVYARIPDGSGEFVDFATSTKGKANIETNLVVVNEIESNDPNGKDDWIELANPSSMPLDISGLVLKDNDDSHSYTFPEGTAIDANGYFVIRESEFGFGLGKSDSVRLFESDRLIAEVIWTEHANPTLGLYPDVDGHLYKPTLEPTPGAPNRFEDIPETIEWPGSDEIKIYDKEQMFLADSSGLDFHNGQLYAVDNGTGRFWILDVNSDGSLAFAEGFERGKRVRFQKDADNPKAAGPDAEGITVDSEGFVYIASERDNQVKGVNYNAILKVDPAEASENLVSQSEWDLTDSLPQVSANMGIESVEWVANEDVEGKLFDENTKELFDASKYSKAIAEGVFFVALEDNGHVYAYVLNEDESFVQIADLNSKLGGAMALDYDSYEDVLWIVSDNGYKNKAAKLKFNGTKQPNLVHVLPPSELDVNANNEGFAIASIDYSVNGERPVYRFKDGETTGSLSVGTLYLANKDKEESLDIADQMWQLGSSQDLIIPLNPYVKELEKVYIDDVELNLKDFLRDLTQNELIIKHQYLESLSIGDHLLSLVFENEVFNVKLTILAEKMTEDLGGTEESINGLETSEEGTETSAENLENGKVLKDKSDLAENLLEQANENISKDDYNEQIKGKNSETLPNTASLLYNYILIGAVLLVLGTALLTYIMTSKRKSHL